MKYRIELDSTQKCMRITESGSSTIEGLRHMLLQLTNLLARYRVKCLVVDISRLTGPTLEGAGIADLVRNEPFYLRSLTRVFVGSESRLGPLRTKFRTYGSTSSVHTAGSLDEAYRVIGFVPAGFKLVYEWSEPEFGSVPDSVVGIPTIVDHGRELFYTSAGEDFGEVLDQLVVKQSIGSQGFPTVEQPR